MDALLCSRCKKYKTCLKICPKVEKQLPKMSEGVLPHTILLDPNIMDNAIVINDGVGAFRNDISGRKRKKRGED